MLSATLQVCLNKTNHTHVNATLQVCLNKTNYTHVKRHPTSVSQ
jgi:hypothetical protein